MMHRNCRCAAAGCRARSAMPPSPSAYPLVLRGSVMFRQSLLPRACFSVVLGLAVVAPTAPAHSQDRLTLERLDRLERDLNMLQRQVYRGAPAPMMGGDPGGAAGGEVRMDRLEQQMRELTGRVEEFVNQIEQLRQRVEQINGDVETRFGQTPSTSGSYAAATPPPPRPRGSVGPGRQPPAEPPGSGPVALTPPGPPPGGPAASLLPPDSGAPPSGPTSIFNTLAPPGSQPPQPDLASAADMPRPPTERMLPSRAAGISRRRAPLPRATSATRKAARRPMSY